MYEGNILFVKDGSMEGSMSSRWLCDWPARVLRESDYYVDTMNFQDVPFMSKAQKHALGMADVVIYERHIDDPWLPFLEWCAKNKRFFLTLDDAYWLADPTTTTFSFWSRNDRLKKLEDVAASAEKVLVPSKLLAEHFENGHFKPNRPDYSDPLWVVAPLSSEKPMICWGGTMGHISGLREHPFLAAASKVCKRGYAEFVGISGSNELTVLLGEVAGGRVIPMQPFGEWLSIVSGSAIVACPLGEGYDEHRSWIKALEASAAGSTWIASDRVVYQDNVGGLLVNDTAEEWESAIMTLLRDWEYRHALSETGKIWAWKQGIHEHLDEWEEILSA